MPSFCGTYLLVRRPGLLDMCAIALFLVVLFLPDRDLRVSGAFAGAEVDDVDRLLLSIADSQVALQRDPGNGEAVESLTDALAQLGRHDMSLRIAGRAAAREGPTRWRSLYAAAAAHAARIEIPESADYAKRALAACREGGAHCPPHEATRLRLFVESLEAGLHAIEQGADPRRNPDEFRREMMKFHPASGLRRVRLN